MPRIPFSVLPYRTVSTISNTFKRQLRSLMWFFPTLERDLMRIEIEVEPDAYFTGAIFSSILAFIAVSVLLLAFSAASRPVGIATPSDPLLLLGISFAVSFSMFMYIVLWPGWKSQQRSADIERNLLFAIRHLTVQTNAGVPLFRAIVSVSEERGGLGYGSVSDEFRKIVKDVEGGKDLSQVLEESARHNSSHYYERIMWQLANATRAGAPINKTLTELLNYLAEEQRITVRTYGAQLSPLALMYMLSTIVGPTLILILMMTISTFVALPLNVTTFGIMLLVLILVQVFFIGLIKSRGPKVAL